MLRFRVYEDGQPAEDWPLRDAHLLGADDIGVRATIRTEPGVIVCEKNAMGAAALCLQVELEQVGELTLQTCLLPERAEPYILMLELARHRLMRCLAKQEEWGMFELAPNEPAARRLTLARRRFIDALCAMDEPAEADRLARESLIAAIDASEELALSHADALRERRRVGGHLMRRVVGCGVRLEQNCQRVATTLANHFDFIRVPTPWRKLEPVEQEYDWRRLDGWCEWAYFNRIPLVAGPLVSFRPEVVPDWLYIWQHDYDSVRDLLYEHVERVVTRYRGVVTLWNVVSGIHVNDHFSFTFEQLMDLTRMSVMLVKKLHESGRALIEITQPFGEYYARNQRSIPPIMYAEMALQAGIPFDAFGLKLVMGQPAEGRTTRDLMQISTLLDRFSGLGKPVHVTATAVPSKPADPPEDKAAERAHHPHPPNGGYWRKPWSPTVQSRWLEAFYNICLSKPFVESVAWQTLTDGEGSEVTGGGLLNDELKPKPGLQRLAHVRSTIHEPA